MTQSPLLLCARRREEGHAAHGGSAKRALGPSRRSSMLRTIPVVATTSPHIGRRCAVAGLAEATIATRPAGAMGPGAGRAGRSRGGAQGPRRARDRRVAVRGASLGPIPRGKRLTRCPARRHLARGDGDPDLPTSPLPDGGGLRRRACRRSRASASRDNSSARRARGRGRRTNAGHPAARGDRRRVGRSRRLRAHRRVRKRHSRRDPASVDSLTCERSKRRCGRLSSVRSVRAQKGSRPGHRWRTSERRVTAIPGDKARSD
jgi:hypothetical protein